jgi:uncharacterized iron-regulated protein
MTTSILTAAAALLLPAAPLAGRQQPTPAPDTSGFRAYTGGGERASLEQVLARAAGVEVLFLGESHNDTVGHRIQREIFSRLLHTTRSPDGAGQAGSAGPRALTLSLEMFECDVQYILDEYLSGLITEDQMKRSARPWAFYAEDYAPVVEAAKAAGLRVLAANAPRRYVNMVSRGGRQALAALSDEAKRYLPPLPWPGPSPAYRAALDSVMGQHGDTTASAAAARENGFLAQSLWDATMAWSIAGELMRNPGTPLVHLVGSFHVKNGRGILDPLARYRPGTRALIVYVEPVTDVQSFPAELRGAGDFVILTDKSKVRANQRTGATGQD